MCKYCEEVQKEDWKWIEYYSGDHDIFLGYSNLTKNYRLIDNAAVLCTEAKFCPWCGHKLEAPEEGRRSQMRR